MITKERIVRIEWRNNPSVFEQVNKTAFATPSLRIGGSTKVCNEFIARGAEMEALLPSILGVSTNNPNWQENVSNWWHSIMIEVPREGREFNTSFTFALDDSKRKEAIQEYKKSIKDSKPQDISSDEEFIYGCLIGELLNGKYKVQEENLYRYVTFVNPEQYLYWRYCLKNHTVANSATDVDKSVHIKFFLSSKAEQAKIRKQSIQSKTKAINAFSEIISSSDKTILDNILITAHLVSGISEFKSLTPEEKHGKLLEYMEEKPAEFLKIKDDKHLKDKARITMYMWAGLIRQLDDSSVIVDASNLDNVIGNSLEEAIVYFNNEINKAYVSELKAKYQSLK